MRRHPLTVAAAAVALSLAACASPTVPSMAPVPPGTVDVTISSARGASLEYVPDVVEVGAGGPIAVTFRNESTLPHNVVFTGNITASSRTIVAPGGADRFAIGTPGAGSYPFVCTIHAGMAGTLVIAASTGFDPG